MPKNLQLKMPISPNNSKTCTILIWLETSCDHWGKGLLSPYLPFPSSYLTGFTISTPLKAENVLQLNSFSNIIQCNFCLFGFLTSLSTTRLYRGRTPRQSVWQFYVLQHIRQSWEIMTSVSARSHYTDTDPTSRERAATAVSSAKYKQYIYLSKFNFILR